LKDELNLSLRSFQKFKTEIINLATGIPHPESMPNKDPRRILVMVGMPGCGKSTYAKKLEALGWSRVNQDEMGTRKACETRAEAALKKNQSVIVDRCNFDILQRHTWVALGTKFGVGRIDAIIFDISPEICKSRVTVREDHPTIPKGTGADIVEKFSTIMFFSKESRRFC